MWFIFVVSEVNMVLKSGRTIACQVTVRTFECINVPSNMFSKKSLTRVSPEANGT